MDFLHGATMELGLGIAIGMLAGTTGTHGSARGRMTILAAAIGLAIGYLLAGAAELSGLVGALFCMLGAVVACVVVSDLVFGAGKRQGGAGALGFIVSLVALVVVAAALLFPYLTLLLAVGLVWLGASRRARARRKHAGLRVLR